jgi:hypothetical protein
MTNRVIDTSGMRSQSWIILAPPSTQSRGVSTAIFAPRPIPPKSPRISDAKVPVRPFSLAEQLFDNAAELKIAASQVAMHLKQEWRETIFKQLNRLLDFDSWQDDSAFIQKPTFLTFLRFVLYASPTRLASLGVGPNGNILAAWNYGGQQIAVEFLSDDQAAASFVIQGERSKELVAWRGHIAGLKAFIERNGLTECIRIGSDV